MSITQPFCLLFGINSRPLSKEEFLFLEAELFVRICGKLKEIIREQNRDYFRIMKFSFKEENIMLERKFMHYVVNDILSTEDYNILGIAFYTSVPEDVIYELASGYNTNPTFLLSRKIIELHRTVRPNLYREIINKVKQELLISA